MSNNPKVQALLDAVEKASLPLKAAKQSLLGVAADVRQAQTHITLQREQAKRVDAVRKSNAQQAVSRPERDKASSQPSSLPLQNLQASQGRLNATMTRYQRGQALAEKVRNVGASSLDAAKKGWQLGATILRPGIDAAQAQGEPALDDSTSAFPQLSAQLDAISATVQVPTIVPLSDTREAMSQGARESAQPWGPERNVQNGRGLTETLIVNAGTGRLPSMATGSASRSTGDALEQPALSAPNLLRVFNAPLQTIPSPLTQSRDDIGQPLSSSHLALGEPAGFSPAPAWGTTVNDTSEATSVQRANGSSAPSQSPQGSLSTDIAAFQSASQAMSIDLYDKADRSVRTLTQSATQLLLQVDSWVQKNPTLVAGLAETATTALALVAAVGSIAQAAWPVIAGINMLVAGAGLLGSAFTAVGSVVATALGAITFPFVALVAAVVAGAVLVRKYWEPISAFFSGFGEGFTAAMGPISDAFSGLTPLFSAIGSTVTELWNGFTQLLEPVKSTQAELAAAGDMGKKFGNMLAEALKIPSQALDQLRGGIDWVLEKLGVIDTKSDGLQEKVPSPNPLATGGAGVSTSGPPASVALGGATYKPFIAPAASAGTVDQSQNSYQFDLHMHEGMTKEGVVAIVNELQASADRNRMAQNRSSMGWGYAT
ncbi:phage tail tape measure protein [Pantoea sp.]|uniref:phage tail tape measure protein n=1 Tax=Pantoea sp. TaxID=69393 RepID=UPI0031E12B9C